MGKSEIEEGLGRLQCCQHGTDDGRGKPLRKLALHAHEGHAHAAHDEDIGAVLVDAAPPGCHNAVPGIVATARKIDDRYADAAHGSETLAEALCAKPGCGPLGTAVEGREDRVALAIVSGLDGRRRLVNIQSDANASQLAGTTGVCQEAEVTDATEVSIGATTSIGDSGY